MGKFIGAVLGFFIFGPIGSLIGFIVGHFFFDSAIKQSTTFFRQSFQETQELFFDNLFGMLAKLAKADGQVTKDEINAINHIMVNELRLDQRARDRAIEIFRKAKKSSHTFESYARNMSSAFRGNVQVMHTVLAILFSVAAADGKISHQEEDLLRRASDIFGLGSGVFDHMNAQFFRKKPVERYYGVLESTPEDSNEVIKANYRRLVKEYHPDKIQAKGLPPEFQEFAKEKFQEIQNAYEEISKTRNL